MASEQDPSIFDCSARDDLPSKPAPRFDVVIPARYASTRLRGKALLPILGKPMIVHVCERARLSQARRVLVATDDLRIADVVMAAGMDALMTSPDHASGTDRLAEVVSAQRFDDGHVIVNVQGDEPMLEPELIDQVASLLQHRSDAGLATAATPIRNPEELRDTNVVKVVLTQSGLASYFSRAPIPWLRDGPGSAFDAKESPQSAAFLRHIGIYAYRVGTLKALAAAPRSPAERAESLEQLRALWLEIPIAVGVVDHAPLPGVDTQQDLNRVEQALRQRGPVSSEGSGGA